MNKTFGKANMNVAGISFSNRQAKIHALKKAETAFLTLRRERNNPHDANAIQVLAHICNHGKQTVFCIGYIPRNKALWLAKKMDDGQIVRVSDYRLTGGGRVNYGCTLTILHELNTAPATNKEEEDHV